MKILSYPSPEAETRVARIADRDIGFRKKDSTAVARIISDVRKNGDEALIAYARRFDSPRMSIRRAPGCQRGR